MNKPAERKKTGTFEERFIRELTRLCDGENVSITNQQLRDNLGWQDERFADTREGLIKKGIIKAEQGRGGKTRFVEFPKNQQKKDPLKVFISYSHTDELLKIELIKHLNPLERLKIIKVWSDKAIKPGDDINKNIEYNIKIADIFILLVSIDFINSNYCYEKELETALKLHGEESLRIVPIILRSCLWHHTPFGGLLALPKDGKAVTSFADKDEAFKSIAESIRETALKLLES